MSRRRTSRPDLPIPAGGLIPYVRPEWTALFFATSALLLIALVLGGASRQHELRLAAVELASLPVIVLAISSLLKNTQPRPSRLFLSVLVGIVAIPLVQLVPLPPAIWTRLPGREEMVLALEISGAPVGWAPISLTPDKSWQSVLALLPPLAMGLAVLALLPGARRHLVVLFLGSAVAAVLLGAVQLASGTELFYPWQTTNAGAMVGFFANRNHMATLCLAAIPMAAALFAGEIRNRPTQFANVWLSLALVALFTVAIGAIRSRMGLALVGPVLAASLFHCWLASGRSRPSALSFAITIATVGALVFLGSIAIDPILARFGGGEETRFENWLYIVEAADQFAPLGSGIGSFDAVYRSVEPLERLDNTYFNQAHNEYLETWLEAGWLGFAVFGTFAVWFARRAWSAWYVSGAIGAHLQKGATIAIVAIIAHSTVDYPLRTATLATFFAFLCAILETAAWSRGGGSKALTKPRRT